MKPDFYIKGFKAFLQLEKSLSENSVTAYIHDVNLLFQFASNQNADFELETIQLRDLQKFVQFINELGLSATSQSRIISGIKSFFKYLLLEDVIKSNPTELLEAPKSSRKLPDTLSIEEVEILIETIDVSTPEGTRNKAIVETMYGCGLRVSELTTLQLSNIYADVNYCLPLKNYARHHPGRFTGKVFTIGARKSSKNLEQEVQQLLLNICLIILN